MVWGVQYERLPFFCFACGILGHSEVECSHPVPRNELGKLPYDVPLGAPEERRRRLQSFAEAVAESWGSGSSSGSRPPRTQFSKSEQSRSRKGDGGSCHSSNPREEEEELEVQSPLKDAAETVERAKGQANRKLEMAVNEQMAVDEQRPHRKRKSKVTAPTLQTPDLNSPEVGVGAIVPVGQVNSRVTQLDGGTECSGGSLEETLKKQRRGSSSHNARSAAAESCSPHRAQ